MTYAKYRPSTRDRWAGKTGEVWAVTCGIYIRVSEPKEFRRDPGNADRAQKQETLNQRLALEKHALARGWGVSKVYEEHASAGSGKERPVFRELMEDARKSKFQTVLFWSLDRFSREGTVETLVHLRTLDRYGVGFCSYQEQYIDSAGPFREALIGIIAALAKMERDRQSERVKAGLDRRKAQGKHVGRVPRCVDIDRLRLAVKAELSLSQVARMFGVGRSTAGNYVRMFRAGQTGEIERLNRLAWESAKRLELEKG
jgi:DNA invertase Pin-like site-specific DNA recombinase